MAVGLSCRFGALGRGLGELLSCRYAFRCSSLVSSSVLCSPVRWFSKSSNLDNHPKRPLPSFIRYYVEQRLVLKKQNPDLKLGELAKKIALTWNELPVSQKQPYAAAAAADQQIYNEEMAKYKAQLTPAQEAALKEERRQHLSKRILIRRKRELTMLGKPKRSRSAVNIFVSEHFHEAEGISMLAKMKKTYEEWKQLPISQKQTYVQLAEDDKVRYENEMTAWEEQMIEVGREDLIRHKQKERLKRQRVAKGKKTVERIFSNKKTSDVQASLGSHRTSFLETRRESMRTRTAEE